MRLPTSHCVIIWGAIINQVPSRYEVQPQRPLGSRCYGSVVGDHRATFSEHFFGVLGSDCEMAWREASSSYKI